MSTQKKDNDSRPPKVTTQTVVNMKQKGEKISMLTAYDYTMAQLVDQAGTDVILVGDSASNVMAGHETTVPMTLDHMIYHASCVVRGVERSLIIADLPFMSYQVTPKEALINAGRMMKEAGVHGVKLEGGKPIVDTVKKIVDAGIPVMGHLGLTPQSIYKFGTYKVRAKEDREAEELLEDARRLQEAGCFSIVLEKIPAVLAKKVTRKFGHSYHRHWGRGCLRWAGTGSSRHAWTE
ncbi:MAG: 3-methyl-2-oxobutanoate hydroxymethyltransferase [Balneolaceae bacterium]|nr:3-methyl-2-oxobutanoate hydroxymethyltransferase [Balneolaceae bacterium]